MAISSLAERKNPTGYYRFFTAPFRQIGTMNTAAATNKPFISQMIILSFDHTSRVVKLLNSDLDIPFLRHVRLLLDVCLG